MFVDVIVLVVRFFALLFRAVAEVLEKFVAEVMAYRITGKVIAEPVPVEAKRQEPEAVRKVEIDTWRKYVKIILFVLYFIIYILAVFGLVPIAPEKVLELFNLMDTS